MDWRAKSLLGIALLATSGVALAQDATLADRPLVDAISDCRKVGAPDARLACFDRAAAALDSARADGGLVVMDRAQIREKRRSLFGFQLPRINLFGGKDDMPEQEQIKDLESTIRSASPSGRDRWTLRLTDNSLWRTIETGRVDPEAGDSIKIRRAALGSYLANIRGARAVRIERVE